MIGLSICAAQEYNTGERGRSASYGRTSPHAHRSDLTGGASTVISVPKSTTETRVVHVKDKVPGAVYIGRANPRWHLAASPFANAYTIGKNGDRARVLHYYASDLYMYRNKPGDIMHLLPELRGKPLACWCRHDGEECTAENRCHGDILVEALNRYTDDELRSFGSAVHS